MLFPSLSIYFFPIFPHFCPRHIEIRIWGCAKMGLDPPSIGSGIGSGIGSSIGSCIGSRIGSSIGSCIGSYIRSSVGSSIGSSIGSSVGISEGCTIGSNVGSNIGISIGSRGIVLNFLYSRILGNGLLRCFGCNILYHTYYNFYWVIF